MSKNNDTLSVYDHILEFSLKRPSWQQDAMRRYVQNGQILEEDLDVACLLCKVEHGLAQPESQLAEPLEATHLPKLGGSRPNVSLRSLSKLVGVNALLPDQFLEFSRIGMTSIFGYNGSGKSGYARVLKRLCRARGSAEPILGNVFEAESVPAAARIEYAVGDVEDEWEGPLTEVDALGLDVLGQVCVYDSKSGSSVIESDQKIEFAPPGLDILDALVGVLEHVRKTLQSDESMDARVAKYPELDPSTKAGQFLEAVSSRTSEASVKEACSWDDSDSEELKSVREVIANLKATDPKKKAGVLNNKALRFAGGSTKLKKIHLRLNNEAVVELVKVVDNLASASNAQRVLSDETFNDDQLQGTGGEPWKRLWMSAQEFSTKAAYPQMEFPALSLDARCVLCQQQLDQEAGKRMNAFKEFMSSTVAADVELAEKTTNRAIGELQKLVLEGMLDDAFSEELASINSDAAGAIREYLEEATEKRDALVLVLKGDSSWDEVPDLCSTPTEVLDDIVSQAKKSANELIGESSAEAINKKEQAEQELAARKTLHDSQDLILSEIQRLKRGVSRTKALKATVTTSVSKQVGKLTQIFVTDALVRAFNTQLDALGGGSLRVVLKKKRTQKGDTYTGLVLGGDSGLATPGKVLSEGEQRIVALAAFFADLDVSPSKSTIVFDDPVTSLDHAHRQNVARRLADEALHRQVLVFTHDTVFQTMLNEECAKVDASFCGRHVQRMGLMPGYCSDDPPWDTKSVKLRVAVLTKMHVELVKLRKSATDDEYRTGVIKYYDLLRKTWERAVEECLLNGCVQRFGRGVETQRLSIVDVLLSDYEAVKKGMGQCSMWIHDSAQAIGSALPEPDLLAQHTNILVAWVQALKSRRPKNQLPNLKPIDFGA